MSAGDHQVDAAIARSLGWVYVNGVEGFGWVDTPYNRKKFYWKSPESPTGQPEPNPYSSDLNHMRAAVSLMDASLRADYQDNLRGLLGLEAGGT